ncbi:MAG: hypothetical protein U1F43_34345 [Myxococcota bacterium]
MKQRAVLNPDGSMPQALPESCDTVDNDCDGDLNEGIPCGCSCKHQGVCGTDFAHVQAVCTPAGEWNCGYAAVAGYQDDGTDCDGLDNGLRRGN